MSGSQKLAGGLDSFALGYALWTGFDEGRTRRRPVPLTMELEAPAKFAHQSCRYLASCVPPLWHRPYD